MPISIGLGLGIPSSGETIGAGGGGGSTSANAAATGQGLTSASGTATVSTVLINRYGWSADLDEGTTGDYFVDGSRPDNSGAGTSLATAKKTITAAVALAGAAGKTIKIKDHGSPYRESVSLVGKSGSSTSVRTRLIGYGTDKPTISGAEIMTGWVPCVSGDAPIVGANWANVYKTTVNKSLIAHSTPSAMNLYEAGVALNEAIDRVDNSDPFMVGDNGTWHTADAFYTSRDIAPRNDVVINAGSVDTTISSTTVTIHKGGHALQVGDVIKIVGVGTVGGIDITGGKTVSAVPDANTFRFVDTVSATSTVNLGGLAGTFSTVLKGIIDTSVTGAYTSAQILRANVIFVYYPNVAVREPILDFTSNIMHMADTHGLFPLYENSIVQKNWTLINILPAIAVGGYGYVDSGGATVDVYVWPRDVAHLTSQIEYSARENGIDIANESNFEIASLKLVQYSSNQDLNNGCCIKTSTGLTAKSNITVRNCYIAESYNIDGQGYGAMFFGYTVDLVVWNNTITNCRGMYGFFNAGGGLASMTFADPPKFSLRSDIRYNDVTRIENTGMRFYTTRETILAFNRVNGCGPETHSNKLNFYEQCYDILIWGNDYTGSRGYITWQETDNIFVAFNFIPSNEDTSARAAVDQNNTTPVPGTYLGNQVHSLLFNNTMPPYVPAAYAYNLDLGSSSNPSVLYEVYNNIFDDDAEGSAAYIYARDFNVQNKGTTVGANSEVSPIASVYVDAPAGDYTLKPGGPAYTKVGKNMQARITSILSPRFGSRFTDWDKDFLGQTFSWTDAPVGHVRNRAVTADVTAPTVAAYSPADNAVGVLKAAPLVLTFSEDVVAGTGNITIYNADTSTLLQTVAIGSCTIVDNVLTIPHTDFPEGANIYVNLAAGVVKDLSNNNYAGISNATTWDFLVPPAAYSPTQIYNNGTAYLSNASSANIFSADSTVFTFSALLQSMTDGLFTIFVTSGRTALTKDGSNFITLSLATPAGPATISVKSTVALTVAGGEKHIHIVANSGVTPSVYIYFNGVDVTGTPTILASGTIDHSASGRAMTIFMNSALTTAGNFKCRYMYINANAALPVTSFFTGGVAVDPSAVGSPEVFMAGTDISSGTNPGSGANFTVNGTFTP